MEAGIGSWILMGIAAGLLMKIISHGNNEMSWQASLFLGIAGALIGGMTGKLLDYGYTIKTLYIAVIGAVLLSNIARFSKGQL